MSAELLGKAAAKMREDADVCGDHPQDFVPAVADLLDAYSLLFCECCDEGEGRQPPHLEHLVAVARAYLGEA